MIGCPRCHTDNADFVQTGIDRKPSPFYDRELDARTARLDALAGGEWPQAVPFGRSKRLDRSPATRTLLVEQRLRGVGTSLAS